MKPTTLLFVAFALYHAYRYARGREAWRIPLVLLWGAITGYSLTESDWWLVIAGVQLLAFTVLRFTARRQRDTVSGKPLPAVTPAEEAIRSTLSSKALEGVQTLEFFHERRLTVDELVKFREEWTDDSAGDDEDEAEDAEEAAEKARDEAEAAETREMKEIAPAAHAEIAFTLKKDVEIEVAAGKHTIRAGEYQGTLAFVAPFLEADPSGEDTPVQCVFEFQDGAQRWRSRTWLRKTRVFTLERPELDQTAVYWKEAPAAWREALRTRALIGQANVMDDGRSRFPIEIGSARHCIMTKYCHWLLSLAVIEGGRRLLVRTHRLIGELWENGPEADDGGEFLDIEVVPAFCWTLPVEAIVPLTAPEVHGLAENDYDGKEPIRFEPAAGTGGAPGPRGGNRVV